MEKHLEQNRELSLLVVDFDGTCTIRVEKGQMPHTSTNINDDLGFYGNVGVIRKPFTEIRAAIDAMDEKPPVPRVTMDRDCNHTLHYYDGIKSFTVELGVLPWAAIVELAGHSLPIYEPRKGGSWTELLRAGTFSPSQNDFTSAPVSIWRYTRRVK